MNKLEQAYIPVALIALGIGLYVAFAVGDLGTHMWNTGFDVLFSGNTTLIVAGLLCCVVTLPSLFFLFKTLHAYRGMNRLIWATKLGLYAIGTVLFLIFLPAVWIGVIFLVLFSQG